MVSFICQAPSLLLIGLTPSVWLSLLSTMSNIEEILEDMNGDSFDKVKHRFKDPSKVLANPWIESISNCGLCMYLVFLIWVCLVLQKVAHTREILSKQAVHTKEILSKQAVKIAKQAEEHERFINKVDSHFFFIVVPNLWSGLIENHLGKLHKMTCITTKITHR